MAYSNITAAPHEYLYHRGKDSMSRHAFGIAVIAGLLCLPVLAQTGAEGKDAEKEAASSSPGVGTRQVVGAPGRTRHARRDQANGYTRGASA